MGSCSVIEPLLPPYPCVQLDVIWKKLSSLRVPYILSMVPMTLDFIIAQSVSVSLCSAWFMLILHCDKYPLLLCHEFPFALKSWSLKLHFLHKVHAFKVLPGPLRHHCRISHFSHPARCLCTVPHHAVLCGDVSSQCSGEVDQSAYSISYL